MNRRKLSYALELEDVRTLSEAEHAAEFLGQPFTVLVTIHFGRVRPIVTNPVVYLRRVVINRIGRWFRSRGIAWTALWVRENFDGQNREHVHLLVHVPRRMQASFRVEVERLWPEHGAVDVRRLYDTKRALRYLMKQLSPQARFAFRGLIRREAACRHTGASVAPVLGRKFGMTRNLWSLVRSTTA